MFGALACLLCYFLIVCSVLKLRIVLCLVLMICPGAACVAATAAAAASAAAAWWWFYVMRLLVLLLVLLMAEPLVVRSVLLALALGLMVLVLQLVVAPVVLANPNLRPRRSQRSCRRLINRRFQLSLSV